MDEKYPRLCVFFQLTSIFLLVVLSVVVPAAVRGQSSTPIKQSIVRLARTVPGQASPEGDSSLLRLSQVVGSDSLKKKAMGGVRSRTSPG